MGTDGEEIVSIKLYAMTCGWLTGDLGRLMERKGSFDEAIACFERAAASRSDNAGAHFCRGYALKRSGKIDEAIAAFREAVAAQPGWAQPHAALGGVFGDKGDLNEAVTAYQRALEIARKV